MLRLWAHQTVIPLRGITDYSQLPLADPGVWRVLDLHLSVVLGVMLVGGLYAVGIGRSRVEVRLRYPLRFGLSMAVLLVALNGPIHHLSDNYLFSVHMVQHLLLTLVFPPLFITGLPPQLVQSLLSHERLGAVMERFTRPVVAWLIYNVCLVAWHLPALYNATMANHDVHVVEHLVFISTAVLLWWPIFGEPGRLGYGGKILYLFLTTLPMKLIGALITMGDGVLYPFYATVPRVWNLDPLADQRLGGLIMWVPSGFVIWVAIGVLFFAWWTSEQGGPEARRVSG